MGCSPDQVVLVSRRKQAKHWPEQQASKQCSSMVWVCWTVDPASSFQPSVPAWLPSKMDCDVNMEDGINSSPHWFWSVFFHGNED